MKKLLENCLDESSKLKICPRKTGMSNDITLKSTFLSENVWHFENSYFTPCVQEINIFGRDYSNLEYLKKRVIGPQVRPFNKCNKWTPVWKTTEDEEVYVLNKCSYSNWKQSNESDLLVSYHDFQLKLL